MSTSDFWVGPFTEPDRYRLVSLLGGGGEGEVWDAVLQLSAEGRSTVAVKIVTARDGDEQEFDQAGRLLRMLNHPGLVRVTESFTGPQMHRGGAADPSTRANYVVMDHVAGMTLREWCDENPHATAATRLKMLRTAASALDVMHSGTTTHIPVAHGDVKPANVIVRPDGGSVLVDLGLARLADGGGAFGRSAPYAAPELRGGHPVPTPEADRYAFAVTVAQVLIGTPVPTTPDGWTDLNALADLLQRSPVTSRRPLLVKHVLEAIAAPPEARPRQLRLWLDSASETLSQVTSTPDVGPTAPYPIVPPYGRGSEPVHDPEQRAGQGPPQSGFVSPTAQVQGAMLGSSAPHDTGSHGSSYTATQQLPPPGRQDPGEGEPPRRRGRRLPLVVAAVVILAIAIGAVFAYLTGAGNNQQPSDQAQGLTAPTTTSPSTLSSTAAGPTVITSSPSTATTGLPTTSQYLSNTTPIERDGSNGGYDTNAAMISGQQYGHAITMYSVCTNHDGGDYWLDYNLSRSWTRFTTTVGIDDRSRASSTATYTLLADNKPVATGQLTIGKAVPIDVPVNGVLRLRLKINDGWALNPKCGYNTYAKLAWGDPTLVP
jgi:serine/threonine protein kinase